MKILILLFSFIWITFSLSAQWTQLASPTTYNLNDVEFLNESYGIVVGDSGTILKTTDGGDNWLALATPGSDNFRNVAIIGNDTIFVSSSSQTNSPIVYRSNDGGQTWQNVLTDPTQISICTTPDNHIYAAAGFIYESVDNGANWDSEYDIGGIVTPFSIQFINKETGHVGSNIGGFSTYSAIVTRTANGGNSWWELDVFSFPNANALTAFSFINPDTGYLFTNKFTFFTPNDSSVLIRIHSFELVPIFGDSAWIFSYDIINALFPEYVNDCKFFSDHTAYCIGNNGPVYISPDDGVTWFKDYFGTNTLFALDMLDKDNGYAVGEHGTILKRSIATAVNESGLTLDDLRVFPNPATDNTTLMFSLKESADVKITLSDLNGKIITEAVKEKMLPGTNSIVLQTGSLTPGFYYVQLMSDEKSLTRKIIISP